MSPTKFFQSRSPKIALNGIAFTVLSYWITLDLCLTVEDIKMNYIKKLCKSHLKINSVKYRIHTEKDHVSFNKKSVNQTFAFISSKSV